MNRGQGLLAPIPRGRALPGPNRLDQELLAPSPWAKNFQGPVAGSDNHWRLLKTELCPGIRLGPQAQGCCEIGEGR
jgi:hypothetical protein